MGTKEEAERLGRLVAEIDVNTRNLVLPADRRSRMACGCLDLALEHQSGIAVLALHQLFGSAFALLRILYEAYVRGTWLMRCASDAALDKFESDTPLPKFRDLLEEIDQYLGVTGSPLTKLRKNSWAALRPMR